MHYAIEQINEITLCTVNPLHFIRNYCYINHPINGIQLIDLDQSQEMLLHVMHENKYSISKAPRQYGKTTCSVAYLVWQAIFTPGSNVLAVSVNRSMLAYMHDMIMLIVSNLPDFIKPKITSNSQNEIHFDNGSIINNTVLCKDIGRGLSISLLYLDEFAFINSNAAYEFWNNMIPAIASTKKCIITSTDNPSNGFFNRLWIDSNNFCDSNGNVTEISKNGFMPYQII